MEAGGAAEGVLAGEGDGRFRDLWQSVRDDASIQFAPVPGRPLPEQTTPQWWLDFLEWLAGVLGPAGQSLGQSWPTLRNVLLALLALAVLLVAWRLLRPWLEARRNRTVQEEWRPDGERAEALLADADALAARGDYDAATRLLLHRSIADIRETRPELVEPSHTAREIGRFEALPAAARRAFSVIAQEVERSLFARRPLAAEHWQRARAAYADFALGRG